MKTINALKARTQLGTVLDSVSRHGEHYIIERLNKPLVAVVPIQEYKERFLNTSFADKSERKEQLLTLVKQITKKYGKKLAGKEGSVQFIRKMRNNRTKQLLDAIQS